jgi:tetratricopeptide (TPR) repeat protein
LDWKPAVLAVKIPTRLAALLLAAAGLCGCQPSTRPVSTADPVQDDAAPAPSDHQSLLDAARQAFEAQRYDEADRLARQVLASCPDSGAAWRLAAEVAAQREEFDEALACYDKVPRQDRREFLEAQGAAAKIAFYQLHRFSETERHFRRVLEVEPSSTYAHGGLAYLLSICGRRWESAPHLLHLVQQGQFTTEHLSWLGVLEAVVDEADQLRRGGRRVPTIRCRCWVWPAWRSGITIASKRRLCCGRSSTWPRS